MTPAQHSVTDLNGVAGLPARSALAGAPLPLSVKMLVWIAYLSTFFLSQVALNIGEFPASTELFVYVLLTALLLVSGHAAISCFRLLIFLLVAVFALLGLNSRPEVASINSLMLLLTLYLPFSIRPQATLLGPYVHAYVVRTFVLFSTVLAVIACVQLVVVNFVGLTDFVNIALHLPEAILGAGKWAFAREDAGIIKANGFFQREASGLSWMMALAIVVEYVYSARWKVLLVLGAGLLASLSGSGIIMLLAAFLIPTSRRSLGAFIVLLIVGVLIAVMWKEIPGLEFWGGRMSEFENENTSGHARFVAPIEMIERGFANGSYAMWFGNGPGSFLRSVNLLALPYEINDPSWAKMVYEYGIIGTALMTILFTSRVHSSLLPWPVFLCILCGWLAFGNVLRSDFVLMVWLITLVPNSRRSLQIVLRIPSLDNATAVSRV